MTVDFPIFLVFRRFSVGRSTEIYDRRGTLLWSARSALLAAREAVTVYRDRERHLPVYEIRSDSLIDIGAAYEITDLLQKRVVGVVRHDAKKVARTRYFVAAGGGGTYAVEEVNPLVNLIYHAVGGLPIIGNVTGYIFRPRYAITDEAGREVGMLERGRALMQERYALQLSSRLGAEDRVVMALGAVIICVLEATRV